jgi:glycosyltransferase involved in cell wall biosynthesis
MSKSVYFVGGHYMGCWYVRCFLPLLENGWSGNYRGIKQELKDIKLQTDEMLKSDIIVFHRADNPDYHKIAIQLKRAGKKIVFDNDDTFQVDETHAFFNLDEKGFKQNMEWKNNAVYNFVRNADLVTASTKVLADEYRKWNSNVIVLPNCVNPDDWDEPLRNESDVVRIGIVGSSAYYHDFDIIKDFIKQLDDDKRVQLVLFGLFAGKDKEKNPKITEVHHREYAFWDTLKNIEHVGWCEMVDYFTVLNELRLDMMIIPRRDSYFNRCKSNIKMLEAAMLDIPIITNHWEGSPYEKDINGKNGVMVYKPEDWLKEIYRLVDDKELRRTMGKEARKYVLNNYNIHDKGYLWEEAYKDL